jgi:2-oxoglutarate ferredoxin oxidoreductase subunit gamma
MGIGDMVKDIPLERSPGDDRYEIRLSGSGGQGLILAGIILAEAAGIYDGRFVVQTQSYGPEARGGVSRSDVIVSDEEIDYPKAIKFDMLVAMNQKSCDQYFPDLKPTGILMVDSNFVSEVPTEGAVTIPFTRIAKEKTGKQFVANIVFLGALTQFCPVVSEKAMETAVLGRVPKGTEGLNRTALEAGIEAAGEFKKKLRGRETAPEDFKFEGD